MGYGGGVQLFCTGKQVLISVLHAATCNTDILGWPSVEHLLQLIQGMRIPWLSGGQTGAMVDVWPCPQQALWIAPMCTLITAFIFYYEIIQSNAKFKNLFNSVGLCISVRETVP